MADYWNKKRKELEDEKKKASMDYWEKKEKELKEERKAQSKDKDRKTENAMKASASNVGKYTPSSYLQTLAVLEDLKLGGKEEERKKKEQGEGYKRRQTNTSKEKSEDSDIAPTPALMSSYGVNALKAQEDYLDLKAQKQAADQAEADRRKVMYSAALGDHSVQLSGAVAEKNAYEATKKDDLLGMDFVQKGATTKETSIKTVAQGILGTLGDVVVDVIKAPVRMGEGIGDLITYGVAGVADLMGKDDLADEWKRGAQESSTDRLFKGVDDYLDRYSFLGRTTDSVAEGIGQMATLAATGGMAGAAGLGTVGSTILTSGLTAGSAIGGNIGEAYQSGATDEEAALYGITTGTAEAIVELLSGGLGKGVNAIGVGKGLGGIDDIVAKGLTKKVNNTLVKNLIQSGVKQAGEGLEEVLSGLTSAVMKKVTYMSEEELSEIIEDENLLEQFVVGAMASGIMQGGDVITNTKAGTDLVTGLNKTEQTVVDQIFEKRLAKAEKDGKKLGGSEKSELYDDVVKDMEKGYLSKAEITEILGGEDYTAYQEALAEENAKVDELEELKGIKESELTVGQRERYDELKAEVESWKSGTYDEGDHFISNRKSTELGAKLTSKVADMVKDTKLTETWKQDLMKREAFSADPSTYKNKSARQTVENLVKSGVVNNSNRSHEMAETLANLSQSKGYVFDFTSNAKLKASGMVKEGTTVNGYISKDGKTITVNMDSPKAWQFIVGHEITHSLEGTAEYKEFKTLLMQYAQGQEGWDNYQNRVKSTFQTYDKAGIDVSSNADQMAGEITADLVGEYIFQDEAFVTELATKHRNVFQKIYDEIKHLIKMVTAGSKEAKDLERLHHAFEKAWAKGGTVSSYAGTSADTKPKVITEADVESAEPVSVELTEEQEEYFKDSKVRDENGNLKVMYHGTSSGGFTVFDPYGASRRGNLFGAGAYFTDDESVANGYTARGKGDHKQVYQTYLNITNPIDMDAIANVQEWEEAFPEADFPEVGTNEDYFRAVEEYMEGMEYSTAEAQEMMLDGLERMGYDGITHVGGDRVDPNGKKHQVYIAFHPEQIKAVDNQSPTLDPDIRFSLVEEAETNQKLNNVGLSYDSDTQTVGAFSLSSLEDSFDYGKGEEAYMASREEYEDTLANSIAETKGQPTEEERAKAKRYLDSLFLIRDMIAADPDRLGYDPAPGKSAWVSNAEYGGSVDFSTLCAKRRLFTGTFDAIQNALPDTVLNENDFLRIRDLMLKKGLESPCSMCYVEGSRAKHGVYVERFLKDYLATNPEWKPQIADFTSTTRLEQTRIQHPEAYQAYIKSMNALAQRKPKEASVRTDYKGEILRDFKDDSTVAEKNKNGGVRFNSFSDFEIIHALDCMQVLTDMARVGLNGQAYTKVKEFAEAFGNTGLKINLSLVAKDVDADGKLIMDEVNGMNYADAIDIRSRYSENVGTVIVVFNDAQLRAALADGSIDYVLPFHRSQWKKSQYALMGLPGETRDYTAIQNERQKNPTTGRAKKVPEGNIMPNEYWDFSKGGRENAQIYLDYINEHSYIPKFDFLLSKVDGKWVLPEGAVGDGYFKLLIDFKMYDNDGWGSPQRPVVPEFNMPYIQQMLEDYKGGHGSFPVASDVVDEFVQGKKDGRYSMSMSGDEDSGIRGDFATPASSLAYRGESEGEIAPATGVTEVTGATGGNVPENPEGSEVAPMPEATEGDQSLSKPIEGDQSLSETTEDYPIAPEPAPVSEAPKAKKAVSRKEVHAKFIGEAKSKLAESGLDFDAVLKGAKDLSTFATVDNTPQRVMEKALGYKAGRVLSDLTVNKVAQNETTGIRWLNRYTDRKNGLLAQISRQYRIKPGSKESAAAQMYAEGFYVNEKNEIIKYGESELAKDFPSLDTQNRIRNLATDPRIRKIYDETLKAINESRARNAYPEIPRLDNYFLHFRAMGDTFSKLGLPFNPNDIRAKDLPTDLNGVTADLKPGQPYFASAQHRTGKRTSFDLLGGLEMYLNSAKNQIYHIDDIQNLRAFRNYIADMYGQANGLEGLDDLGEAEQQERIAQVYGAHLSTFAKFLNEEANVIAGKTALIDRGIEGIIGRRGMTFLDSLNRQVGANMVGGNISSALTNFIAPIQAFAKTNKLAFIKGMAQFSSNKVASIFGKGDGFADQSPVMVRRNGIERFHRTLWQKMSDPGYLLMSAVDEVSTELIARAKYNEYTAKGMSAEQAHIEADKWTSRLMGDRSLGQQPQLYNSKMLGIVTKFQLEVRNQLDSQFYDTIQETKASNEDIKNGIARNAKTAAQVTSTFVQLAVLQHIFGKAFESVAGYNPAFDIISAIVKAAGFDDEEEDEDTILDNLGQGLMELVEDLPYSSLMTGGRIPMASALPIKELFTGKDQYGNEKLRLETISEAAPYYLMPGGYGQVKKTLGGMDMFSDEHPISGSYTDSGNLRFPVADTPLNRVQAGLFGQWASGNARNYFDGERSALNPSQTQEFIDSGMSIQEYWRYRDGMKGMTKNAEKLAYINSLPLDEAQKNALKSHLFDEAAYKEENPERYAFFEDEGIGYLGYRQLDEETQQAWSWAYNHQDKYRYLKENGVMPEDYSVYHVPMLEFDDEADSAFEWAFNNPEKAVFGKVFSDGVKEYRQYATELSGIKADKDEGGKTISGSRKAKVLEYINSLDIDYGERLILFKREYNADDSYNSEIIDYLNSREDISFEDTITILRELGFTVTDDGAISWD